MAVGTRESGFKLGWLATYSEGNVHVCGVVCGDCPLGWDRAIIFISYVVAPLL